MAAMQGFEMEFSHILSRLFYTEVVRGQEMKPPYDINNPGFFADYTGILRDVADPCMGTPGDDDKPVICTERKGGIVRQEIRLRTPVGHNDLPGSRFYPFKGEITRDLS
jgi:hypothetical protein